MRRAAMQHAQAGAQPPAAPLSRPRHAAPSAAGQAAAACASPGGVSGHPSAEPTDLAQQGAVTLGAGTGSGNSSDGSSISRSDTSQQGPSILSMLDSDGSSMRGPCISHVQHEQSGSGAKDTSSSALAASTLPTATASAQHGDHHDNSKQQSRDGGKPYQAPAKGPSMKSIIEEYRRIRGGSSAPGPAWLIGSPLLQVRRWPCLWHFCSAACAAAALQR